MKTYLLALSGLIVAALLATSANAVPASGIKAADIGSNVIQVDYYRHGCHWWNGHRHCWRDDDDHPSVVIDLGHRRYRHDHDDHHDHDMHGDKGDHHNYDKH